MVRSNFVYLLQMNNFFGNNFFVPRIVFLATKSFYFLLHFLLINERYNSYKKMVSSKFVDLFEIKNFVFKHFSVSRIFMREN